MYIETYKYTRTYIMMKLVIFIIILIIIKFTIEELTNVVEKYICTKQCESVSYTQCACFSVQNILAHTSIGVSHFTMCMYSSTTENCTHTGKIITKL